MEASTSMITLPYRCRDCGHFFMVKISMKRSQKKQPCHNCGSIRTTFAEVPEAEE